MGSRTNSAKTVVWGNVTGMRWDEVWVEVQSLEGVWRGERRFYRLLSHDF